MRIAPWFLIALLWLAVSPAHAETSVQINTVDPAHLAITLRSPFDLQPGGGYAPVEIYIHNQTGQRGTWQFRFNTSQYGRADDWNTAASLTVEDGAERTLRMAVPLAWRGEDAGGGLAVNVAGAGLAGGQGYFRMINQPPPPVSLLGVSVSLATPIAGFQTSRPKDSWTLFRPQGIFDDWRTMSGFDSLWLTADDLRTLSASQRICLQEWVARGGVLVLFGTAQKPSDFAVEGLGRVLLQPGLDAKAAESAAGTVRFLTPRVSWFPADYKEAWPAAESVGAVRPNVLLLVGLVALLAVINGPINLYVFCGGGRRSRLLWVTPAISFLASGLLVVFILLQDGVGGSGVRYALVALLPGQNKAALLQEQVSRSGVLLSTGFRLENPSLLVPISPQSLGSKARHAFTSAGEEYRGDWFGSRRRDGYWLETVIPTRAEVRLVPGVGGPTVISSIEATLSDFYLRDAENRIWHAHNLRTGEKTVLEPVPHIPSLLPESGRQLRAILTAALGRPGWFYATTEDGRAFQPTLRTLRWKQQRAVYLGPVTVAAP